MQSNGQTDRHDEARSRSSQFCEERLESKIEVAHIALLRTIVLALSLFILPVNLGFVNICFMCTAVSSLKSGCCRQRAHTFE